MKKSRFREEQMVTILREADRRPVPEGAKQHGVSAQTIYSWRKHFGTLEPADVKRLRLCLPKTSSPHYVHWALLRISRRPASITGHADRLSRTVHRVGLRPAEPGGAPD